jgi:multidrug efflux pump subunit AcrB
VLLRDVARVEISGESFEIESFYNGKPTSGFGVRLAAGANALDTANAVRKRIDELSPTFPPGSAAAYPLDSTPFVRISIEEVVKTWPWRSGWSSWSCSCSCRTCARR